MEAWSNGIYKAILVILQPIVQLLLFLVWFKYIIHPIFRLPACHLPIKDATNISYILVYKDISVV